MELLMSRVGTITQITNRSVSRDECGEVTVQNEDVLLDVPDMQTTSNHSTCSVSGRSITTFVQIRDKSWSVFEAQAHFRWHVFEMHQGYRAQT